MEERGIKNEAPAVDSGSMTDQEKYRQAIATIFALEMEWEALDDLVGICRCRNEKVRKERADMRSSINAIRKISGERNNEIDCLCELK